MMEKVLGNNNDAPEIAARLQLQDHVSMAQI